MPALTWATLPYFTVIATLGGVYLWSKDPGRRARALGLLRLLIGRRLTRVLENIESRKQS
jgi:hypothetical protein